MAERPSVPAGEMRKRRVIEALRSGVPSTEAVRNLGCPQPAVKAKFQQLLNNAKDSIVNGWTTKGILIEGGFGTGKSHLLESLQHTALEQNFVCSKVVISKETPLYSPLLMFRAACLTPQRWPFAGRILGKHARLSCAT